MEEAEKMEDCKVPDFKSEQMKQLAHEEMVQRAVRKQKDVEKKQKRKEEDLIDLIYDKDFSISKVTWEEAQGRLSKHTAYKELSEERAQEVFEEWLAKEKDHKESKKSKKRKHSDSDSGEEGEVQDEGGEDGGKKSKKEKKSKKHKKDKKKKSEAHSDSD